MSEDPGISLSSLILVVALLGLPPAVLARGDGSFQAPQILNVPHPVGLTAGHFNRDGKLDLATVNGSNRITILYQESSSRGEWKQTYLLEGIGNFFLRAADLDADGDDDLVVADPAGSPYVLQSGGDGTFQKTATLTQARGPRMVAVGDWNQDGKLDLASANHSMLSVSVFLGEGDGTFIYLQSYPTSGEPHAIEALDFDGDGALDLAVGLSENGLQTFRGRGDGEFERRAALKTLGCVRSLSTGDLNGDGRDDVVTSCFGRSLAALSLGDGSFQNSVPAFAAASLALADLNSDRVLDIVFVSNTGATLSASRGKGDGTFHPALSFRPAGSSSSFLIACDLDADDRLEVISADRQTSTLTVFRGGDGEQLLESSFAVVAGFESARCLAVADLDGDGAPELFLPRSNEPRVHVYRDLGRFLPLIPSFGIEIPRSYTSLEVVDLDSDGVPDLAGSNLTAGVVVVVFLEPSGRVRAKTTMAAGLFPTGVVAGRVDGGDTIDLVVPSSGSDQLQVFLNRGRGTFGEGRPVQSLKGVKDAALGDLDEDGQVDLAVIAAEALATQRGARNGDFSEPVVWSRDPGRKFTDVAIGDLDLDGVPDLLASEMTLSGVLFLKGWAGGGFEEPRLLPLEGDPVSLALADLNGDGLVDLTTANKNSQSVSVLLNRGVEGFSPPLQYRLDFVAAGHRLVDLDRDGTLDIVTLSASGSAVSVLRGRPATQSSFRRGDVTTDAKLQIDDPILILSSFFLGGGPLPCQDAADANDDGELNIVDPIALLDHLFLGGKPLPPPGPDICGEDPTPDDLAECQRDC